MNEGSEARGGPPGKLYGSYLAEVVSVNDDKRHGRVQVRLLGFDGVGAQNAPIWARVAVPFAGAGRGAFFIPNKGDEVVVQFIHGDPRLPVVIGSVWSGRAQQPEELGGGGEEIDRWTFVGKRGTRVAIVEEASGPKISLTTPNATESIEIVQQNGGSIEIKTSTSTIRLEAGGVTVTAPKVKVDAVQVELSAAMVNVDTPLAKFTGIVQASCFQSPIVAGSLYTPGAGGIW